MDKFVKGFIEVISWIRIALSPTIVGVVIGGLVYLYLGEEKGFVIGAVITGIGGIIGVLWASNIWKNTGTTNFISRKSASNEDVKEHIN